VSRRGLIAAALAALALGGCGILDEGDPEELTVELSSEELQEVLLVMSTEFVLVEPDSTVGGEVDPPPRVELIRAESRLVESPWSQVYDIREIGQFFVRIQAPDSLGIAVPVTLTVRSDGSLLSSKELTLSGASVEVAYQLVR
jgi:hypothetical protein